MFVKSPQRSSLSLIIKYYAFNYGHSDVLIAIDPGCKVLPVPYENSDCASIEETIPQSGAA